VVIAIFAPKRGFPVISLSLPVIFGRFPALALIFLQILHRPRASAPFTGIYRERLLLLARLVDNSPSLLSGGWIEQ
jgi:hypothetical protein